MMIKEGVYRIKIVNNKISELVKEIQTKKK